ENVLDRTLEVNRLLRSKAPISPPFRLLLAGVSTRAAAASAARAGFIVTALDAFGDFNPVPSVCVKSVPRDFGIPFSAAAAARAARHIDCDTVAYISYFAH